MQKTSPSPYDLPPSYVPPTSFSSGNVLVSSSSPVFRPPLFRALPLQTSFSGGTTGITGRTFRPKNPRPFVLPKPSKTSPPPSNCDLPFSYVPSSSSSSCSSSYSSSSSTTGSPSSSSASSPVVQALPLPPRAPILTSREARITVKAGGGKIDRSEDDDEPPPLPPRTYILLPSFPTTTTTKVSISVQQAQNTHINFVECKNWPLFTYFLILCHLSSSYLLFITFFSTAGDDR